MKLWLSATEIADLALPACPASKRGVTLLAEREGWADSASLARRREGRGGGLEYHVNALPAEARIAYLAREGRAEVREAAAVAVQSAPDISAPAQASLALDARLHIVGAFRSLSRTASLKASTAVIYFVDLYNAGHITVPAWVREAIPALSARTLQRWLSSCREGEIGRLAVDRGAARRGSSVLETGAGGRVKAFALGLIAKNQFYSARHVHEALTGEFPDLEIPSIRAVQRALEHWKAQHATELLALTNPDRFVSTTRIAGSYAHLYGRLNQRWQIDASPVDALCTDGRHSIYVCIDVFSRRFTTLVTRTPRSEAVQMLLRKAILLWGAPEEIKTDNGSDFVARATQRLFHHLGITPETSTPFAAWEKGVVERAIKTLQHDFATTLPGFIGHSVADRKVIENRKAFSKRLGQDDAEAFQVELTSEQLQREADTYCTLVYEHREHGGIGKQTPFARAATWTGKIREVSPEALHVLLMQAPGGDGIRTVGKQGVRVEGFHYLCPGVVVGERVFVRLDPADAGRIYLFDADGTRFLGLGQCAELAGEDRAALVAAVQAAQRKLVAERTAPIRAEARQITPRTVLDHRNRQALERAGKLVALPKARVAHVTPQIEAAASAAGVDATPTHRPAARTIDADVLAAVEADVANASGAATVTPLRTTETPHQRFRRALALEERRDAGGQLTTDEAIWLGGYQASAECRSLRTLFEEFGEQALS